MAGLLALLFLVVPLIELFVIIQVGQSIGALPTIALLLVMSVAGGWLMRREGMAVWRRVQGSLQAGRVPGADLGDAFLILFGGALMLTPGFLSDLLGLSLLVPPVRTVVRRSLFRRFASRMVVSRTGRPGRSAIDV